jgi:FkbM family methyltransferase
MEKGMRRCVRHLFAKAPGLYLALLKGLRRGSPEKRMYLSIVRKRDVVFDIGANTGHFTELFSDLVGPFGEVHAFEPVPSTFKLLSTNISEPPAYKNVFLNCAALGAHDEETSMFIPNEDCGQAALVRHRTGSWASDQIQEVKIHVIQLDYYAQRFPKIDFVKCDAEGAELLVLRGGKSTLRRCRPRIFLEIEECWTRSFGWTPEDVVMFLREVGYRHFYWLGREGLRSQSEVSGGGGVLCTWEKMDGLA